MVLMAVSTLGMYVCACACMYMYVHVCACMCMYVHVCACMCMYVHVCACMYVHVCVCREKTCLDDCGPYWCEVRTNAGSVCVSESARVELQYHEETRDDANWRKKEGQYLQREVCTVSDFSKLFIGERFFRTNKEERFGELVSDVEV